ncbi:energy transducer TonB [Desulfoluna sp.]|uniref:energy transducer TonB n=1 Tax=Desulfoluna sp. TaxID=2045199 RepID=UPI002636DDF5|nr:energy transducer TonB [Desulfoluna sp.]
MKHLIFPACAAALFHALFFLMPMPTAPVISPSAPTHGTTITVSMTVPSVQAAAPAKSKPVKAKPKKKKPEKPKKIVPRKTVPKKVVKKKRTIVEPLKEVTPPVPPDLVKEPAPINDEPVTPDVVEATVQNTAAEPEEASEPASAPAVGGIQSDAQPTSVYAPEPRYPKAAIRRGYQGVVLLDILVNGEGTVEEVRVKKSSGHGALDKSAVKGVKRWRFSASGVARSIWVTLPVRFELTS